MELFSEFFWSLCLASIVVGFVLVLLWILISGYLGAFPKGKIPKLYAYTILFPLIVLIPISFLSYYSSSYYLGYTPLSKEVKIETYEYRLEETIANLNQIKYIIKQLSNNTTLSSKEKDKLEKMSDLSYYTNEILIAQQNTLNILSKEASRKFYVGLLLSIVIGTFLGAIVVPYLQKLLNT